MHMHEERLVVTASEDGTAKIWAFNEKSVDPYVTDLCTTEGPTDADSWQGHTAAITCVSVSPGSSSEVILTASKDSTAKVWSKEGRLQVSLEEDEAASEAKQRRAETAQQEKKEGHSRFGHTDFINSAVWSKKSTDAGQYVVTASDDCTACVWNSETGKCLGSLEGHTGPVAMAQYNHHLAINLLLTCSHDCTCKIFDSKSLKHLSNLPETRQKDEGHQDAIWSAYFSPNDANILSASKDGTAKVWDVRSGKLLHTLKGHTDVVLHASFNPLDPSQVMTCSMDNTVKLWDVRQDSSHPTSTLSDHKACVWSAVFGKDPKTILTASHDMTALVYDQRLALPKNTLGGHTGILWDAILSPDDHWVVTCSEDTTARVWNLQTGARRPPCHILRQGAVGHSDAVTCATFLS